MPYGGEKGRTLPHFSGRVATGSRPRGQRACKYGPRGADGYCPKKPRSAGGGRPCKYGPRGADGYCPKRPTGGSSTRTSSTRTEAPRRQTAAQRDRDIKAYSDIAVGVGQVVAANRSRIARVARTSVRALPTRNVVGLAVAAGLAAFGATTAVLRGIKKRKDRIAEEQRLAAAGYRVARANMEAQLGRAMTRPEHDLLAAEWRAKLPQAR